MSNKIHQITDHSFVADAGDGKVFMLSNHIGGGLDSVFLDIEGRSWENSWHSAGGHRIVPYGPDNLLPSNLRNVISKNNLVPGILERQMGLLYGQGAYLCRTDFTDGQIIQHWTEDKDIQAWLDSWDYITYLKGCITDYLHLKGFFDAKHLTRGHRIGQPRRIAHLEHIPAKNARLEWADSRKLSDVKHIIVGDYEHQCLSGIRSYPIFDPRDPGKYAVSASYNNTYSFSRDMYSVPQYWGALRWIIRGSEIPLIFKYVTDNGLNLAYHVHSPSSYWDYRRDILHKQHPEWTDAEVEVEIAKITMTLLESMTEVLTGKENAGKFIHTIDVPDDLGHMTEWKIEPIDQKIKDFVESQLKISEASVSAITSGMGLHPSLSNIMVNGKLASGSEMLYAFKLYLNSDVEIASQTILQPLNQAINFNFPGKNLRMAFYHQSVKTEESLSSSDRIKNQ